MKLNKKAPYLLIALLFVISIFGIRVGIQSDDTLSSMTPDLWKEDLRFMVKKTNTSFASFKPHTKIAFNQAVDKLYKKLPELNNVQTIIEFNKLLSMLNDGHTELNLLQKRIGFNRLPFIFYYFGGELRIIMASEDHKNSLGDQIISIGNVPVKNIHQKIIPLLAHDNEMEFQLEVPNYITSPEVLHYLGIIEDVEEIDFHVIHENGNQGQIKIKPISRDDYDKIDWIRVRNTESPPLYLQNLDRRHWFQYIQSSKTMYFKIHSFSNAKGHTSLKKLTKEVFSIIDKNITEKFVLDLRLNRGGNYNLGLSIVDNIAIRPTLNKNGKLFIITDRSTFSASGTIAAHIRKQGTAIIIGEMSRDNPNGSDNYEPYALPNSKVVFGISNRTKVHYPGLTTPHLPLDIKIITSFEDYKAGRDPIMEYILLN